MLSLLFVALLILVLACGIPIVLNVSWVPSIVRELLIYGKGSQGVIKLPLIRTILVPKRWFTHFYLLGSIYATLTTGFAFWNCYEKLGSVDIFENITALIYVLEPVEYSADSTSVLIALVLFSFHMFRRLYECLVISTYSPKAPMNLIHYLAGILHYLGVVTALVVAKPGCFRRPTEQVCWNGQDLHVRHLMGLTLYVLGCYYQHQCVHILANLRKNSEGKVITQGHSVPKGGLFQWVTCPHYLCEIAIYVGFYFILGFQFWIWGIVTLWVAGNQIVSALISHQWYFTNFPGYAKSRKAILPGII